MKARAKGNDILTKSFRIDFFDADIQIPQT